MDTARLGMSVLSAALIMASSASAQADAFDRREACIRDTEFVVTVPSEWQELPLAYGESMRLRLRAFHEGDGYSDFEVFELDQGILSQEDWFAYYRNEYLPSVFGRFRIDGFEEVTVGNFRGRLFHVLELKNKSNHGVLEAMVFTGEKVLFLRYLYFLPRGSGVREEMNAILASFSDSPAARARAGSWFRVGATLGLEATGLFLKLPADWFPDRSGVEKGEVLVSLPSGGSMRVIVFRRSFSGIDDVKKQIGRRVRGLSIPDELEPVSFGTAASPAVRFEQKSMDADSMTACILGLHGRRGYALLVMTADEGEMELFGKVAAEALLMEPREAAALRRTAEAGYRKAVGTGDAALARECLSTLVLYSENRTAIKIVSSGLKGIEEIQVDCATALGRMGSSEASNALRNAIKNSRSSNRVKKACADALNLSPGGGRSAPP